MRRAACGIREQQDAAGAGIRVMHRQRLLVEGREVVFEGEREIVEFDERVAVVVDRRIGIAVQPCRDGIAVLIDGGRAAAVQSEASLPCGVVMNFRLRLRGRVVADYPTVIGRNVAVGGGRIVDDAVENIQAGRIL